MLSFTKELSAQIRGLNSIIYISLICLFLGFFHINKQSLWLDEYTSIQVAEQSLKKIITGKAFDNHTPPFYYLLLHFWLKLGKNEFILRSLSVIFGILSIYLIYYLAKIFFNNHIALMSAFLIAISPFHIYYCQEGRMYTLFMALSIATIIFFIKIINTNKFKHYLSFFLVSVIGLYTHYYFAFLLLAINLAFFYQYFIKKTAKNIKYWVLLQIFIALSLLPWLPILLKIAQTGGQHRKFVFSVIPYAFFRFNVGYAIFPLNIGVKENFLNSILKHIWELIFIFSFFGILFLYGLKKILNDKNNVTILLWLFFPALLSLIISLKMNIINERYLIVSFPAYVLLISLAILSIKKTILKNITIGVCCFVFLFSLSKYYFSKDFGKEQWRDVAKYISMHTKQKDLILVNAAFMKPLFCYYYQKCDSNVMGIKSKEDLLNILNLQKINTFWLIHSHSNLNQDIINTLKTKFLLIKNKIFPYETGIKVYCFKNKKNHKQVAFTNHNLLITSH